MNPSASDFAVVDLAEEKGGKKRLSVERIYQKKTQLEHILLRPDTYVGSVEETTENMYVYDAEKNAILKRQVTFVPGLYKIFDEILGELTPPLATVCTGKTLFILTFPSSSLNTVNAADNKQRDKSMTMMKIVIDP